MNVLIKPIIRIFRDNNKIIRGVLINGKIPFKDSGCVLHWYYFDEYVISCCIPIVSSNEHTEWYRENGRILFKNKEDAMTMLNAMN